MRLIVYWGFNAVVSSPHLWRLSLEARENGAVISAVDPRRSKTAKFADIWVNPRPGTDVALAYGISRYIIEHGYIDEDFIERWTYGYEQFREEAMRWTPDRVEAVTGVRWRLIEELADVYCRLKPSVTMIGIGLQKSLYGAESVRAISLIPALLGIHRGFFYSNSRGWYIDIPYISGEKFLKDKPPKVSQVALSRYIEEGRFKFIFIYNMNPLVTLPDQEALRRGLTGNKVFVVLHDTHWSETADYADVVLPAPTYLEKDDLVISYSHRYVRISRRAIEPLGDSRDEIWLMREIAKRLNLNVSWIFEDPWRALEKALDNAFEDGCFRDLVEGKILKLKCRPRNEYQTPTGRIEFYSIKAEREGLNPLPKYYEFSIGKDEFILLNSSTARYTHTQFREVYGPIPPIVLINPKDAERLGIEEGDEIEIYNELGSIRVVAHISLDVSVKVLWSPRQLIDLSGKPQNVITLSRRQKIGGGPIFNSIIVKIGISVDKSVG